MLEPHENEDTVLELTVDHARAAQALDAWYLDMRDAYLDGLHRGLERGVLSTLPFFGIILLVIHHWKLL